MNPVTYAEVTLEVHEVFNTTKEAHQKLDETLTLLTEKGDARRHVEQHLTDREMEIVTEERGKHPDMSQAQMDKHIKSLLFQDAEWKKLRDELRELKDDLDGIDADRKVHERSIEIGCARMNQLGGYLNYLAAAKNASTASKA